MKKIYKLIDPNTKDNFIVLSIAQKNWWAFIAHSIRLAAWFDNLEAYSHSALGYLRNGIMYVIEMKGSGARIKPFEAIYGKGFVGSIKGYLTPYSATPNKVAELLERNSHYVYDVPLAIKSELDFLTIKKGEKDSFCSEMVIDDLEFLGKDDKLFEYDSSDYTPSELDVYLKSRKLHYELIFNYELP